MNKLSVLAVLMLVVLGVVLGLTLFKDSIGSVDGTEAEPSEGTLSPTPSELPTKRRRQRHEDLAASIARRLDQVQVTDESEADVGAEVDGRIWQRSSLWRGRERWNQYPPKLVSSKSYAADPFFNPESKSLSIEQAELLDQEIAIWGGEIRAVQEQEARQIIGFLRRNWENDNALFKPGSEELEVFKTSEAGGLAVYQELTVGGMRDHPKVNENGTVMVTVLQGECPEIDTAKRDVWMLALAANDFIGQFFENLE